jgi:hypothetical protein
MDWQPREAIKGEGEEVEKLVSDVHSRFRETIVVDVE